jgi:hypothetical protein
VSACQKGSPQLQSHIMWLLLGALAQSEMQLAIRCSTYNRKNHIRCHVMNSEVCYPRTHGECWTYRFIIDKYALSCGLTNDIIELNHKAWGSTGVEWPPRFLIWYQGHTGAPAGPTARKLQPWFPAWAPGALFRRACMDGMAGGGGWGCHQPLATLPGWGHGAAYLPCPSE